MECGSLLPPWIAQACLRGSELPAIQSGGKPPHSV